MKAFLLVGGLCTSIFLQGQNTRIKDYNAIGWYTTTATFPLAKKWSLHTEFQWRRDNFITHPQQNLYRTGINYLLHPSITLRVGYAFADTYNYGDIPLQVYGKRFPEHRMYQVATLSSKTGRVDFSHRFMLEQRWVGRYASATEEKVSSYVFSNRMRYMFRMQVPFSKKANAIKTPYAALYDEILIGFGKNVNANVYDQNRFGALLGYRFSTVVRIDGGFFSQILQLGRLVNGKNVFQFNQGFIVNAIITPAFKSHQKK